ncbi:MAG: general secretion pathway protein GspK [Verrucomicrobia bacterium]|nr:general secretion pathway protein GspK [Verrucomicrobiota bacterium]
MKRVLPLARERGSALLIVLWALMLLTFVILGLARQVSRDLEIQAEDNNSLEARALAYSGAQIALHPSVTEKTPALMQEFEGQRGFKAALKGEGGRLNLNWIVAGEDQKKIEILKTYLANRGLTFSQREAFVDCLMDWVDPDNERRLNGNELPVRGPISNQPLQDLSELKLIPACDPLTSQADWDKDFSVLSQGPIDLQWASLEVLAAIPGVGEARARALIQFRAGPDGEEGTSDDRKIKDKAEAQRLLGLSQRDFEALGSLLSLNDPTIRVISEGRSAAVTRRIEAVVVKQGNNPQILQWKEY